MRKARRTPQTPIWILVATLLALQGMPGFVSMLPAMLTGTATEAECHGCAHHELTLDLQDPSHESVVPAPSGETCTDEAAQNGSCDCGSGGCNAACGASCCCGVFIFSNTKLLNLHVGHGLIVNRAETPLTWDYSRIFHPPKS